MRSVWASGIGGIAGASAGGLAEYAMTGGSSTWIPLLAGLVGAVVGLAVSATLLSHQKEPFYTPRTVSELTSAVRGITSVEADLISKQHIGSRIKVSGAIADIWSIGFFPIGWYTVILNAKESGEDEEYEVRARFSRRYSSKLRTLRIGDHMKVDGKIIEINSWTIGIGSCRILNLDSPQND